MKLTTGRTCVDGIRFTSAYVYEGNIILDGYYTPEAHTEGKLSLEMDFADARWFLHYLKGVIDTLPCPSCGRKEAAK